VRGLGLPGKKLYQSTRTTLYAKFQILTALSAGVFLLAAAAGTPARAAPPAQDATLAPELDPPYVECCRNETFAHVRTGPSAVDYPEIGMLTIGETAKAVGKSRAGTWIQIRYSSGSGGVAWVFSELVILHYGETELPVVDPPPTPTPKSVNTIDPTFAAQFSSAQPTRLATFTPATPAPTITLAPTGGGTGGGLPPAVFIIGLLTLGAFGGILSAVMRR
jgi:uncharacterized protein YraI